MLQFHSFFESAARGRDFKQQSSSLNQRGMSDSTTTATASSAVETPVDAGSPSTSTERAAAEGGGTDQSSSSWGKDGSVNDYSRFEKLDDPAEEDPLAESVRSKDRGNSAFKEQKFEEAITHYTEAISDLPPKRDDKKNDAARSLRVSSSSFVCELALVLCGKNALALSL